MSIRYLGVLFITLLCSCTTVTDKSSSSVENNPVNTHSAALSLEQAKTTEQYQVILAGTKAGKMTVEKQINDIGYTLEIDYGFKNNGRGPDSVETVIVDKNHIPMMWTINGKTTFGNEVSENFSRTSKQAVWTSAAGKGSLLKTQGMSENAVYIAQNASPYATYLYAKALLNTENLALPALPTGTVKLMQIDTIELTTNDELSLETKSKITAKVYALSGIDLNPTYIALDQQDQFLALMSPRFALIRDGFEGNEKQLRDLSASLNAQRYENIAKRVTHDFSKPVRITDVRLFDPQTLSLTELKSVVINKKRIQSVDSPDTRLADEVLISGNGGTLIPGLYEMHGHMSDNHALLNVIAGVTSVRDMGNEIEVLEPLIEKIENNILIGPRITKSAFIEGESQFSNSTGELAKSEAEAVQLVRDYAERGGYHQVKLYSSVKGEWVPAIAAEARKHGMRVAGHIPAFSKVDEMIDAGYNEITHINQVMLSWVLKREEDTRTLFRITGMKRFADLDLNSEPVQRTLNKMTQNNIAVDPTNAIHELAMTGRNGVTHSGMHDYIENMPIGVQRSARSAMLNVADDKEDQAYQEAYQKIVQTLKMMHEKGIFIVAGTDLGGAFHLHRELELFTQFGMSNAEVLKRASYDMANYLGYGDELGSIETGKLADFFLVPGNPIDNLKAIKTISMVVKDGKVYFPSEVYPEFGIEPFTEMPVVSNAE